MPPTELRLRIVVLHPPPGVAFAVQRGREELLPPTHATAKELVFELTVRVADRDGAPNFLGPYAQGPVGERFVYVNSGQRAGEAASIWDRRAKIHLKDLDWPLVKKALAADAVLETRIEGTGSDGGPACATVPLLGGWRLV